MKAKDLVLRVVNEIEEGKFEIEEFKPYMSYESFIGCILGDAEILRPTGFKDKHGKEIFEGDIVSFLDSSDCSTESGYDFYEYMNYGEVYWSECGFFDITNREDVEFEDRFYAPELEILGNKFKNPNLLDTLRKDLY